MAESIATELERFRVLGHSAFVVGYSGAVGKALVAELNKTKIYKKVVLIGRREIPINVGPEFEQRVVDFNNINDHEDAFKELDAGFCCLGIPRAGVTLEQYNTINRDYVLRSAQVARNQGCKHFSIVSGSSADKNSCFAYPRTKGEVEEQLGTMNFDRLSIYRPALIITDREEKRGSETFVKVFFKPIIYLAPTFMSVPVETLARTMVRIAAKQPSNSSTTEIYDNKMIHSLAEIS